MINQKIEEKKKVTEMPVEEDLSPDKSIKSVRFDSKISVENKKVDLPTSDSKIKHQFGEDDVEEEKEPK
jgi:hypothetical protein